MPAYSPSPGEAGFWTAVALGGWSILLIVAFAIASPKDEQSIDSLKVEQSIRMLGSKVIMTTPSPIWMNHHETK